MERPAQRYFCNKCGYVGNVDLHPGCGYLAYHLAPFEQNYIDQLEKELADIKKLAASPASAPEGFALVPVVPTHAILDVMFNAGIDRHDVDLTILYRAILAAAPTPPVSEDRKDAELLDYIQNHGATIQIVPMANRTFGFEVGGLHKSRKLSVREAIDAAMQEDKP